MAGEVNKHKPVNILDPDTPCQIVGMHPGQTLKLRLTKGRWTNTDVLLESKFAFVLRTKEEEKFHEYEIAQTAMAEGKNALSTFFLGEVRIGGNAGVNLILYQNNETIPYKNTITTVCPTYDTIRIKPFQYLEVVLMTDGMPNFENKWDWNWLPSSENIGMEQVGYRFVYSAYLQYQSVECYPFNMMEHSPDGGNVMQHHFWFRCEREIVSLLSTSQRGLHLGKLCFRQGNSPMPSLVNIYIDLHKRYQSETEQVMKNLYTRQIAPQRPQFSGPVCRSISLDEIEFKSLDEGCRTVGGEDAGVHGEKADNVANH